jgi:hypothetical protein
MLMRGCVFLVVGLTFLCVPASALFSCSTKLSLTSTGCDSFEDRIAVAALQTEISKSPSGNQVCSAANTPPGGGATQCGTVSGPLSRTYINAILAKQSSPVTLSSGCQVTLTGTGICLNAAGCNDASQSPVIGQAIGTGTVTCSVPKDGGGTHSSGGLSAGVIVGIVISVLVLLALIVFFAYMKLNKTQEGKPLDFTYVSDNDQRMTELSSVDVYTKL